jgi:hypothetical protein
MLNSGMRLITIVQVIVQPQRRFAAAAAFLMKL